METSKMSQLMQLMSSFMEGEDHSVMRSYTNHREAKMRWQKAMETGTLSGKPFSPSTIKAYVRNVDLFLEKYGDISYKALEHWFESIPIDQFSKKYDIYRATMSYAKFLVYENCLSPAFLEKAKKIQPRRHQPPRRRVLTEDQIKELLSECKKPQEKALVLLLASTGIRASECANLRVKDLDLAEGTLTIHCGKGGKTRRLGLLPELVDEIKAMLDAREDISPENPVFTGKSGQPLTRCGVAVRLRRVGKRVWIDVSPHDLRRSFVTINARRGVNFDMLQIACGHAFMDTTRAYCQTHEEEVVKSMRSWHFQPN